MSDYGYIRLSRKFFENEYWAKKRSYSQAEAWLDLIQLARFEAEPAKKILPNGRQISVERCEIHASLRYLSARWGWGLMQVRTFLRNAVEKHQITQRVTQGENIITLCKYDDYNPLNFKDNTPDNTPDNTLDNTPDNTLVEKQAELTNFITHRQHTDNTNNNKENKEKKENKYKETPSNEGAKKESFDSSCPSEIRESFGKFNKWVNSNALFCANPKNFTHQISLEEFRKLKEKYTSDQIANVILQIENRKDLRKRYSNLYRTVLNWAKKEYGE